MNEPLIDVEEVAEMIGMSVPWIRKETRRGNIPHLPLGRRKKYRRAAIEQWIAENEIGGK